MGGKKGVGEEQVAEGAGLDGVIETEDGETVDGEGEGTTGDDGVEHNFEGIKVRGVVARSRRLDRELKHDERRLMRSRFQTLPSLTRRAWMDAEDARWQLRSEIVVSELECGESALEEVGSGGREKSFCE